MKKIPTLFRRNPDDRAHVLPEITPGCEWVLAGEGQATQKYDGTCVMFDGQAWWARREVKAGKEPPAEFRIEEYDPATGKSVGWMPMEKSPFARYHAEALEPVTELGQLIGQPVPRGTYELIGPKINGNPERSTHHRLERHETACVWTHATPGRDDVPTDPPRLWHYLSGYMETLAEEGVEGLVWHHPDGRMAKLKVRDFGFQSDPLLPHPHRSEARR